MPNNTLNVKITTRNDSKTNWTTNNPKPLKGEMCIEFDPSAESNSYSVKAKVGDGVHNYNDLPYLAGEAITVPAPDGTSIVTSNDVWSIAGFGAASAGTFPVKRTTGGTDSIEWVTLPSHIADLDTMYTKLDGIEAGAQVNTVTSVAGKTGAVTLSAYDVGAIPSTDKGSASGVAELDANGKVPSSQLPSYVDDVIEGYYNATDGKFYEESTYTTEITGETGKIYVSLDTNKTYRWSGSAFVVISETLALGETDSTAYRGDRGKIAYDHSQTAHAPANAEANVLESVSTPDGALTITNKGVTVPTATSSILGLVKGSSAGNEVAVGNDGTMEVNSLSTDKLTQGTNTLVLQCGTASS